jgi:hypothetical protein
MTSQLTQKSVISRGSAELKARGPNRTTKTVGKLKVLPEQAEPAPSSQPRTAIKISAPTRDSDDLTDSEDEAEDEAEDETEEAEVEASLHYNHSSR